ncbi:MAG: S41 family peptidase [Chloroflexota bacterium]
MSDQFTHPEHTPPTPRAASSLAALVLLVVVFAVGIAVGQSGLFGGGSARPTSSPVVGQPTPAPSTSGEPQELEGFDLFRQALGIIRNSFVGRAELDDETLVYGAIRGLVEALGDTGHSIFMTPEQVEAEQNSLDGAVVGIGVLLGERAGNIVIVSVIPGGPADDAGIRAGDRVVEVNGESVVGLAPEDVASNVRGDEGSTVELVLERPSTAERLELSMVRERLHVPAADWALVPGTDIGVLRLVQFSAGSADDLRAARDVAAAAGARRFILDLRGNPGGYVDQAVNVSSLFLRGQTVYIRELASGERIPVTTNNIDYEPTDLPLVVLIDENTASSAEITAGAIQSAGRAQLVGQTTFGTGTVLLPFPLPDGSQLRLAVERWLTPDAELIFDKGITPDVNVELGANDVPVEPQDLEDLTPEQVQSLDDPQLLEAIDLVSAAE